MASWSEDQNRTLNQWNYVAPPRDYFDEDFDPHEDWYNDQADNDYED